MDDIIRNPCEKENEVNINLVIQQIVPLDIKQFIYLPIIPKLIKIKLNILQMFPHNQSKTLKSYKENRRLPTYIYDIRTWTLPKYINWIESQPKYTMRLIIFILMIIYRELLHEAKQPRLQLYTGSRDKSRSFLLIAIGSSSSYRPLHSHSYAHMVITHLTTYVH